MIVEGEFFGGFGEHRREFSILAVPGGRDGSVGPSIGQGAHGSGVQSRPTQCQTWKSAKIEFCPMNVHVLYVLTHVSSLIICFHLLLLNEENKDCMGGHGMLTTRAPM